MYNTVSQRYQKALVTVAMGFRTEEDIKNNGLYRFVRDDKKELIDCIQQLFKESKKVLALKIKAIGYRSEHINIESEKNLSDFINNIDKIVDNNNEIWVVCSSAIECWRSRIYIAQTKSNDSVEMAYSFDDHILDHMDNNANIPYTYYTRESGKFQESKSTLSEHMQQEATMHIQDIFSKYNHEIEKVREDLQYIGIDAISLDCRINKGYDFHDFDVAYGDVEKVIKYYMALLNHSKHT